MDTQAETGVLRSTEEGNGRCVQTDVKASEELHWGLSLERQIQAALACGAVVEPAVLDVVEGGVEVGQTVMSCDIPRKTMVRAGFLHQPCSCWEKLLFFSPSLRQSFPAMGPPECVLNTLEMALRQKEFLGISLYPTSGQAEVIRKRRGPAR